MIMAKNEYFNADEYRSLLLAKPELTGEEHSAIADVAELHNIKSELLKERRLHENRGGDGRCTAQKIIDIALKYDGYSRWKDPKDGTIFGRWYAKLTNTPYFGTNGVPYCAMFVSYVFNEAAFSLPYLPTASCTQMGFAASKAGAIIKNKRNARPGDIVLFDWGGDGSPDHVGIVLGNYGSYIQTIEGNTSSGSKGSQSNGGGVYQRTRDWNVVNCVIRPIYVGEAAPASKPAANGNVVHSVVVDGYLGRESIKAMQFQLKTPADGVVSGQCAFNSCFYPAMTTVQFDPNGYEDGSKMVEALQIRVGAEPDGIIGKETVTHLQQWLRLKGYKKHKIDGYLGVITGANVQNALNSGLFKN